MKRRGLILMETLGWIAWAKKQSRFAPQRFAAIGNSGGGAQTIFLAALAGDLAVLSSSGHPNTFECVALKDKRLCHCIVLPGIVGRLEMWRLLASFAPKPMFLFQGQFDDMFPLDIFFAVARKVRHVYRSLGAEAAFVAKVFDGQHGWDEQRVRAMGEYLSKTHGLSPAAPKEDPNERLLSKEDRCLETWPSDALTADGIAEQLSGRRIQGHPNLWDVFPPRGPKQAVAEDIAYRGSTRQILAQYEAFLGKPMIH